MAKVTDYSGIEVSGWTTGPRRARTLTVYISAPNSYLIEETGIGLANIFAHKRGYTMTGALTVPIAPSVYSGQFQTKIEYTERWR